MYRVFLAPKLTLPLSKFNFQKITSKSGDEDMTETDPQFVVSV